MSINKSTELKHLLICTMFGAMLGAFAAVHLDKPLLEGLTGGAAIGFITILTSIIINAVLRGRN